MLQKRDVNTLTVRADKLDLLERLADDLAHEIKNPLHSMVINLEVLKRRIGRVGDGDAEEVLRYVGVLGVELERVSHRIELLLRLARPGRAAEHTTLDEMVAELVELVQLEGRRHQVEVHFTPASSLTRVHVPRDSVRQVILDLTLDLLDRISPGGVLQMRIADSAERSELHLSGAPSGAPGAIPRIPPAATDRMQVACEVAERIGGRVEFGHDGSSLVFSLPRAATDVFGLSAVPSR